MAAFMRHGVLKTGQHKIGINVFPMCYATKAEKKKGIDRKPIPKIDSSAQSLAAKGFLRPQKEYTPPNDLAEKLETIFKSVIGNTKQDTNLTDLTKKFQLLSACADQLGHSIPNSLLHKMETLGDVVRFYETPVDVATPLDKMRNMDLPKNLHVQFEYHRFRPETDEMFGGKTAFNESSTIVTGLKYKEKYPGHVQKVKEPWF